MAMLSAGGTVLPSPVSIQIDDEIIWSSESGRDLSGLFAGDVIAQKKTVTISWGILTEAQVVLLQQNLVSGYFPLTFRDAGGSVTIDSYRGTLSKVALGDIGDGVFYFKSASCKIIQR